MTKELDKARRARYRINNVRNGRCQFCSNPTLSQHGYCLRHWVFYHLRKRGLLSGLLKVSASKKREAFVAYVQGRVTAIKGGMLAPGDATQRLRDVTELRLRLGITWGGVRGADKMADILRLFDLLAMRERGNGQG
jgi:hypothetical protein